MPQVFHRAVQVEQQTPLTSLSKGKRELPILSNQGQRCRWMGMLMDEFDQAVAEKDAAKVRSILKQVELTEESIKPILEKLEL
jgi:hypothetical protein